jgi:hypothetical protein
VSKKNTTKIGNVGNFPVKRQVNEYGENVADYQILLVKLGISRVGERSHFFSLSKHEGKLIAVKSHDVVHVGEEPPHHAVVAVKVNKFVEGGGAIVSPIDRKGGHFIEIGYRDIVVMHRSEELSSRGAIAFYREVRTRDRSMRLNAAR